VECPDAQPPPSTAWQVGERFRGWRLDHFLSEQIPKLSRAKIQSIIHKRIRVSWQLEGKRPQPSTKVQVGGKVIADFPKLNETAEELKFAVLYEDGDLLAVNKPKGVLVHPTNRSRVNTLIEAVRRERNEPGLTLTHRLDRDTSGVLLLARNANAARECGKAFMARKLHKVYLALVRGRPKESAGTINQPIGKAKRSRILVRRGIDPKGESAVTHFRVLRSNGQHSLLELSPVTGRRHQLRVHLEWIGCPIVGDILYGHADENFLEIVEGKRKAEDLKLHAWKLTGEIAGRLVSIESPIPDFLKEEK
jgi:23S rRNA pseudouridine1911/1915/1917 synthase